MARMLAALRNWILRIRDRPALLRDGESNEYKMKDDGCWIADENLTVHIIKTDEGVVVDVYGLHQENEDAIASTWAAFNEAEVDETSSTQPVPPALSENSGKNFSLWFGSWYANENDNEARLGIYAVLPKDKTLCLPDSKYCAGEVKSILQTSVDLLDNLIEEDVKSLIEPWVAYAKQYGIPIDYDHDLVTISVS